VRVPGDVRLLFFITLGGRYGMKGLLVGSLDRSLRLWFLVGGRGRNWVEQAV